MIFGKTSRHLIEDLDSLDFLESASNFQKAGEAESKSRSSSCEFVSIKYEEIAGTQLQAYESFFRTMILTPQEEEKSNAIKKFRSAQKRLEAILEVNSRVYALGIGAPQTTKTIQKDKDVQELEAKNTFIFLAKKWRDETALLSSPAQRAMNSAYQQIIGMGAPAVRFILEDLNEGFDWWFWALKAITRQDPARDVKKGDVGAVREAWLAWGRSRGWI